MTTKTVKTNNRQILNFSLIIILLCFIVVFIFNLPSITRYYNLSTEATGNIGSAIGGITAPIIGIVSSILLYLALTKQTQSNVDQRLKNESDIIFLLLNQLDTEVSSFYFSFNQSKGDDKKEFNYLGLQAFHVFVQNLNKNSTLTDFKFTFRSFYQAKQILLILRSFSLIEKRIELAQISEELKSMFTQKLISLYQCKLEESLIILINTINKNPHLKDSITEEIIVFVNGKSN